jgi:hypothetical protein
MDGMADWVKRISKAAGDELQPGERIVAGVLLQPAGTSRKVAGAAAGGLIGAAVASRLRKKDDGSIVSDEGIAATVPDGTLVAGLTSGGKLLLYGQAPITGRPKDLRATLAKRDVAAIEVTPGKLMSDVAVAFVDGTGKKFETPAMDKSIEKFAAEFS